MKKIGDIIKVDKKKLVIYAVGILAMIAFIGLTPSLYCFFFYSSNEPCYNVEIKDFEYTIEDAGENNYTIGLSANIIYAHKNARYYHTQADNLNITIDIYFWQGTTFIEHLETPNITTHHILSYQQTLHWNETLTLKKGTYHVNFYIRHYDESLERQKTVGIATLSIDISS